MEKVQFTEINDYRRGHRRRVWWGAIFAGTAVVLAVSMLLSLLGSAIGMFILDPAAAKPFSGVFGTVSIWTGVSILIGLACGGFVAGKLAGTDGFIHGFVVWSVTMIAGVMMVGSVTAGMFRMAGKAVGVAGQVVAGAGSVAGDGISAMADEVQDIFGTIDFRAERDEVRSDVRQALRRSGVKEFQPEYLRGQYNAVSNDLKRSVKRAAANPQHAGDIINDFTGRLDKRIDSYANNINRDDVVRLVANNSNLSRAQAEDTVDQYMQLIEQGREQLRDLRQTIDEAGREWEMRKQELLKEADKAANHMGWVGVGAFIALLLGCVVSSFAGSMGATKTKEGYDA